MRRLSGVVATVLCASSAALAVVPHAQVKVVADVLTAMPAAALPSGKTLRRGRDVRYGTASAPAAWTKFAAAAGGSWSVAWDRATGVPTRIWGSGIAAPGAMASPAVAEIVARAWLAAHLALLAPGATASDFLLVSNTTDGDIRSVGFVQQSGSRRVLGGQIGFEFKRDRLFVIGSTALPNVTATVPAARLAPAALRARALTALRDQLGEPAGQASALQAEVIVPLVGDDGVLGYRVATPVTLDVGADGAYLAYVDPTSGLPIAVIQRDRFATGTLVLNGVDRYPGRGRVDRPAPNLHVSLDGAAQTTDAAGGLTWSPDVTKQIGTSVAGDFVVIANKSASGTLASTTLPISPNGTARWDASAVVEDDAQLVTYLSINKVKDFVRTHVDAQMDTLDDPITANVNIDDKCNAFFDGKAVNFFRASTTCQNTGLIEDVMFHEFGHSLHEHEIIDGVGQFEPGMSEGVADFLAVNITNDPGLGRGFFYDDKPLRNLDPDHTEAQYPQDQGEVHTTGLIFGETWWDLRKAALAAFGDTDGETLILKLYVGTLRRSVDIPSSLVEALATDDDDGDLSNGTPHECMIRTAYATHGMHTTTGAIRGPGLLDIDARAIQVAIDLTGLSDRCSSDTLSSVSLSWGDSAGPSGVPAHGDVLATRVTNEHYYAQLPLPTDGANTYFATVKFASGTTVTLPDLPADPQYQVYQAHTIPLYCTDFESGDPLADGWTMTVSAGSAGGSGGAPWAWTEPDGSGATDPPSAFSGTHALVQAPGGNYNASSYSAIAMPKLDVHPYSDVRLQYRRWLGSEDSKYDQARITANGTSVWLNATTDVDMSVSLQHIDREWRFQDVPLSGRFSGTELQVGWEITSDEGLEFGGWALDDVCIVANPDSICGDGVKSATEQCDNGAANSNRADACRTDCSVPRCGDGIIDMGEDCDVGSNGDATCSTSCKQLIIDPGGCAAGGSPGGGLVGGLLALLATRGRARRRARRAQP